MGVLYCFGGGAVRRVSIQVGIPSWLHRLPRMAAPLPKKYPGEKESCQLLRLTLNGLMKCSIFLSCNLCLVLPV